MRMCYYTKGLSWHVLLFQGQCALVTKVEMRALTSLLLLPLLMLARLLKLTKAPALTVSIPELNPLLGLVLVPFKLPGEAYGMFGRTQTGAPFATLPSTTFNHMAGVVGNFAVIGTYANDGLMAGVMGIINTNTLSGDAAVMAFMQGDAGVTTCRSAFGVAMAQTTPGSGFEFGLDLKMQDPILDGGGSSAVIPYTKANIRMEDDVVVMVDAGAPVNGTTGDNFAGTGSLYVDSTAGVLYINTGAISNPTWVVVGTQS
jgi:hypothetical protein